MNPLAKRVLIAVATRLVAAGGGILIAKGWLSAEEAGMVTAPVAEALVGLAIVVGTVAWGWVRAHGTQVKINTANASNPMSLTELDAKIARGVTAPASTPKTEVPVATTKVA